MVKSQDYINILFNIKNDLSLPLEICEKIVFYMHTYKFKDNEELKNAIDHYPNNINQYGNISYWDVSNITDMNGLFWGNYCYNISISNWDVSNVINMEGMFSGNKFNGDISDWNVRNVKNMSYIFFQNKVKIDISKWYIDSKCILY